MKKVYLRWTLKNCTPVADYVGETKIMERHLTNDIYILQLWFEIYGASLKNGKPDRDIIASAMKESQTFMIFDVQVNIYEKHTLSGFYFDKSNFLRLEEPTMNWSLDLKHDITIVFHFNYRYHSLSSLLL